MTGGFDFGPGIDPDKINAELERWRRLHPKEAAEGERRRRLARFKARHPVIVCDARSKRDNR